MAPSYTTLFVSEHCEHAPPVSSSEAQFLLLVCPARPLEMGTNVHLLLVFDPPELVPFFPIATRAPFTALRLDIWGKVVGVESRDRRMVEFEVVNWNEEAPIRRAHIVAPWLPGLTAGRDLRGLSEAGIPETADDAERRGYNINVRGQTGRGAPHTEKSQARSRTTDGPYRPDGRVVSAQVYEDSGKPVERSLDGDYASWDLDSEVSDEQVEMYESYPRAGTHHVLRASPPPCLL